MVILELIHARNLDSFSREGMYLLDKDQPVLVPFNLVIHDNFANRKTFRRRWFIQISALSTFDGRIEAYHGRYG